MKEINVTINQVHKFLLYGLIVKGYILILLIKKLKKKPNQTNEQTWADI